MLGSTFINLSVADLKKADVQSAVPTLSSLVYIKLELPSTVIEKVLSYAPGPGTTLGFYIGLNLLVFDPKAPTFIPCASAKLLSD